MKIRSKTASWGISTGTGSFHLVEDDRGDMAEPDGDQAKHNREADIGAAAKPFSVLGKVERLQAEGGKGRITPAESHHDELARRGADEKAAVGPGEGGKKADDQRTQNIDEQGAPGEGLADPVGHEPREPIAGAAAQRASDHDPEIVLHGPLLPFLARQPYAAGGQQKTRLAA